MCPSEAKTAVITREICENILSNYTNNKSTTLVSFEAIKQTVVGYFGDYFRITLTFHGKGTKQLEKVNFFVKKLPEGNEIMKEMDVFKKEVFNFNNLISPFLKLTTSQFAPNCYYSDEKGLLVLEDLAAKGFKVVSSNYEYFTPEQNKALMETLARFHAASLIFEENRSTKNKKFRIGNEFPFEVVECTFSFTEGRPRNKWCKIVTQCVGDLIKLVENDDKFLQPLKHLVFNKFQEFLKPSKVFRNVLNHDDLHQNNILFSEKPQCILIDYQLTRYTPPAFDVLLALHLNNSTEFLDKNKNALLEIYYNTLSNELEIHDLNPKTVFPAGEFEQTLQDYMLPVLIECAFYGTNVLISQELSHKVRHDDEVYQEFMTVNRSKYILPEYQNNGAFRERYNQVLMPLINYLKNNIVQ